MRIDISNMCLNTPLDRYEHMKFHLKDVPQEVIEERANRLHDYDLSVGLNARIRKSTRRMMSVLMLYEAKSRSHAVFGSV